MLVIVLQQHFPVKDTAEDTAFPATNYFLQQLAIKSVYSWRYSLYRVAHSPSKSLIPSLWGAPLRFALSYRVEDKSSKDEEFKTYPKIFFM